MSTEKKYTREELEAMGRMGLRSVALRQGCSTPQALHKLVLGAYGKDMVDFILTADLEEFRRAVEEQREWMSDDVGEGGPVCVVIEFTMEGEAFYGEDGYVRDGAVDAVLTAATNKIMEQLAREPATVCDAPEEADLNRDSNGNRIGTIRVLQGDEPLMEYLKCPKCGEVQHYATQVGCVCGYMDHYSTFERVEEA